MGIWGAEDAVQNAERTARILANIAAAKSAKRAARVTAKHRRSIGAPAVQAASARKRQVLQQGTEFPLSSTGESISTSRGTGSNPVGEAGLPHKSCASMADRVRQRPDWHRGCVIAQR